MHRHYRMERFLKYGQETSSSLSSLKQPRKLEVQDLYGKKQLFLNTDFLVVDSGT